MKKLIIMVIFLFMVYFGIQIIFNLVSKGHDITYKITSDDKVFTIEETFSTKIKHEKDNYYFNVNVDNQNVSFITYSNFQKNSAIIKDIKYFESDGFSCFLPIFKSNKIVLDIMCKKNKIVYSYHDIEGKYKNLDFKAKRLSVFNYNQNKWKDNLSNSVVDKDRVVYPDNLVNNHYIGVMNYKGLETINLNNLKKIYDNRLFETDIIINKQLVTGMVGKYYISADYSQKYDFRIFHLIDLLTNQTKILTSPNPISFDSYFQGVVGDSIYLYDKDNKKQYEINVNKSTVKEVGNTYGGYKYYNKGKWERIQLSQMKGIKTFINKDSKQTFPGYYEVDQVGTSGNEKYYVYEKKGKNYNIYLVDSRNSNQKNYLLTTSRIDYIYYLDNYIYYIDGAKIKYINTEVGVKTIFSYKELNFNKNIGVYAYKK